MKKILFHGIIIFSILCTSCSSISRLMPVTVVQTNDSNSIRDYRLFYVIPTSEVSSVTGSVFGNNYCGTYGTTYSKSINPADEIAGSLIRRGYVRLPHIDTNFIDQTLVVSYGITGRRQLSLTAYATEITIQFLSARTYQPVCTCTSEGVGETETDDIRVAIERCFEQLFPSNNYGTRQH